MKWQDRKLVYLRGRVCFVDRLAIKPESNLPHGKALLTWRAMWIHKTDDSRYLGVHFKYAISNANNQTNVKYLTLNIYSIVLHMSCYLCNII